MSYVEFRRGGHLDPPLLNLFNNAFPSCVPALKILTFVDDVKLKSKLLISGGGHASAFLLNLKKCKQLAVCRERRFVSYELLH